MGMEAGPASCVTVYFSQIKLSRQAHCSAQPMGEQSPNGQEFCNAFRSAAGSRGLIGHWPALMLTLTTPSLFEFEIGHETLGNSEVVFLLWVLWNSASLLVQTVVGLTQRNTFLLLRLDYIASEKKKEGIKSWVNTMTCPLCVSVCRCVPVCVLRLSLSSQSLPMGC